MMSMIMSSSAASTNIQQHIRRLLSDNADGNKDGISNDKDFHMNLIAIAVLIVFLFIAAHITDRVIRCCYDFESLNPESTEPNGRQRLTEMSTGPTLAYSTGLDLAGVDQDMCSVCLSEFVEGDEIRVLPRCKHGFHVKCIESWLMAAQNTSCPTCRTSCLKSPSDHEQQQQHIDVEVGEASTSETGASSSTSKDEVDLQSKLKMKEVLET